MSLLNLKQLGINTTLLATSISLVACGGGDGGYFPSTGNGNTDSGSDGNTSEDNQAELVKSIVVHHYKDAAGNPITQVTDGSIVEFTVQILNKDKGGIEGKEVALSIQDSDLGVTSESSKVVTTAGGYATFRLNIPKISNLKEEIQLVANVVGTSIAQPHTLTIFKTSQLQSEYQLNAPQDTELDLPNGTASITTIVTDKNGGVKANQQVTLGLPESLLGKLLITTGSTQQTNEQGQATFSIQVHPDLKQEEIKALLAQREATLEFTLIDEHSAQKTIQRNIIFKTPAEIVQKLEIIKEDKPIVAKGGSVQIKVRAKDSNNRPLSNKKVSFEFTDLSEAYGVRVDHTEAVTDQDGYAVFHLTTNSSYPIALENQGISFKVVYAEGKKSVSAPGQIRVITENTDVADELALQRLEVLSSYKVNAKDDSVTITVKGINNKGQAATKGKVTLSLNAAAVSNAVRIKEKVTQDFQNAKDGIVSYTLTTAAQTPEAIQALVEAGIVATFTTDNGISVPVNIAVESDEKSEEAVSYLMADPINAAFDYTKDQDITIKVKAIGANGSALTGEIISVALPQLSPSDLQSLGLSLKGPSSVKTEASDDGYATFKYSYKANGSERQKELALDGLNITAKSSANPNAKATIKLNFKSPAEQTEIDLDYFSVEMPGYKQLKVGEEYIFAVTVDAKGTDNKQLKGQKIGLGLNDAELNNGVSLVSASTITTDQNGRAVFSVKVKANNTSELNNLIANGITIGLSSQRKDGSFYTVSKKIEIMPPPIIFQDLVSLEIVGADSIPVLGGEKRVKVIAKDAKGQPIANTSLAIALSSLSNSRISLSETNLTTNSKGEAEFNVILAEGLYDADLIKKGITFAVVGTNLNNGDRLQQTSTIQVTVPDEALNLRLTADSKILEFGQTKVIQVAVKDETGFHTGGVPVRLSLPKTVTDLGVSLSHDAIVVSKEGNVQVDLIVPAHLNRSQKDALLALGDIVVTGEIKQPNGQTLKAELSFNLKNTFNLNSLSMNADRTALSVTGDRTIVTAILRDQNGNPVRHQEVKLSALNTASLIIGTPGGGHPTNTSDPQTVLTDSLGRAFFSVEIDPATVDPELLIASGIELIAEHVNEDGDKVSQIHRLEAYHPDLPEKENPSAFGYNLRIESSKPAMNIKNDMADVTVTLLDRHGGAVENKYVTLELENFQQNGAVIVGPSGLITNELGQATFRVRVDETMRDRNYPASRFDEDELNLRAFFHENGYRYAQQIGRILINPVVDENPRASIVIGVNPTDIEGSSDGVYYTRNLSATVTDFEGKPLANQAVDLTVTPTTYLKGQYIWALAPVVGGSPTAKWVGPTERYYANNPNYYVDGNTVWDNNGTPNNTTDDTVAPLLLNAASACIASEDGTAVTNTDVTPNTTVPVKVVTFLGKPAGSVATYTTDKEGKFDFTVRYPKIYAQWLNVQISATSVIASLPRTTTYNLGLPPLNSDYSTDGTYGPNLTSPYGTSLNCQ